MITFDIRNNVLYGANYSGNDECLTIPSNVVRIVKLKIHHSIKKIIIPQSVKEIDIDAFSGGTNLIEICSCSDSFVTQNNCLFDLDKTTLYLVSRNIPPVFNIPCSVKKICCYAFAYCTRLCEVSLDNKIDYIGPYAFSECSNLTNINLPSTYDMELNEGVFKGCSSLQRIVIPKNITSIGRCAFFDCWKLEDVKVESNRISLVGFEAFASCEELTRIDFLDGVITIEDGAFIACNKLTEITLPKTVINLGLDLFRDDDHLTVISSSNQVIEYCKRYNIAYLIPR